MASKAQQLTNRDRQNRRVAVMQFHARGFSTRQIADAITNDGRWGSISHSSVAKDVNIMIQEVILDTGDKDKIRGRLLWQLTDLTQTWLTKAKENARNLRAFLALQEKFAKHCGVDRPTKIALGGDRDAPPVKFAKAPPDIDLSKLTKDEVMFLVAMHEKIGAPEDDRGEEAGGEGEAV